MQTVRQGDTHAIYWRVVDDVTKAPLDLTGATVVIHVQKKGQTPINLDAAVVAPGTDGRISHTLTGLLVPGEYALEAEVTGAFGIQTAPTKRNDTLTVVAQIA